MRILLDAGIFIHSEFGEGSINPAGIRGVVRKAPKADPGFQYQIDALFTVGRLIREHKIEAFKYWEIDCERWRGNVGIPICSALRNCGIKNCQAAVQRSKFRQTIEFAETISKGGKKDIKNGMCPSPASQIGFLEWLYTQNDDAIALLIFNAEKIRLSSFEIESLENINWFRFLCRRSGRESYPDIFHLWAAERNRLDALLTLDDDLPNLVSRIQHERGKHVEVKTLVLRPLDLLPRFGIDDRDPVPIQFNRFYHLHEL